VLAALNRLSRHRLLDRLIGGRAWIGLVAFALIGIVTLQLGLLELNSSIGRSLEREGLLQRENAALSIENSELAAGNRVESRASALGMELVPIAALRFLTARPESDASRAASALSAPAKAPSTASTEASSGAAETSGASSAASPTGEQAGAPSSASAPAAQSASAPAGEQATAQGESEASTASAGAASPVAGAGQSAAPSSSPPAAVAGPAEGSPAGGTQAGPTG
jgi:cytoskeletal protein RodZ